VIIDSNSAIIATLDVNLVGHGDYENINLRAINEIKSINPREFSNFEKIFYESSMIFAFSMLDSFLSEVEEALFLHNPNNIGESVQVKFGKIIESADIYELIHDIAKKKVKERSQWGLLSRLKEIVDSNSLAICYDEEEIKWLSRMRNSIVHNKRLGSFEVIGKSVTYKSVEKQQKVDNETANKFIKIASKTMSELYLKSCCCMGITKRFKQHKINSEILEVLVNAL